MVRKRRLTAFLYFMLISNSEGSMSRINISDFPEDLGTLCPYTSFCDRNASQNFQSSSGEIPCCQRCSCKSTCGFYNNCCYKHLDIFKIEETYQMVCKSCIAIGKSPRPLKTHYRMINKCLQTKLTTPMSTQISKFDFYPVFSRMTGFIYFNVAIAHCNLVHDIIPFRKVITCSSARNYLSDAARLIRGEEPETDCFLQFFGPRGVDLKSEICEPNVIRKCSVTGNFSKSDPLWTFCEAFNATFISQKAGKIHWYGNIYCFLCNEPFNNNDYQYPDKCHALDDFLGGSRFGKLSLAVVLDTGIQSSDTSTKISISGKDDCPVNMVMIKSISTRCRQVQCPTGKIRLSNRCDYYSEQWIGGPFVVMFRLTPVQEDIKIPMTVFEEMSEKDRNDRKAKWLKRNTMRNWRFFSLYHPSPDNFTIDFIVAKAIYPSFSVDPNAIEQTVKRTLEDSWQIVHKNENIVLKISLNDYITYQSIYLGGSGIFANDEFAYCPDVLLHSEFHNEFLYQISKFPRKKLHEGIFLTKLFFCEQVDLLAEEFDDHRQNIFFKVKNITLSPLGFRRVEVVSNSSEKQESVRVCLSEFQPVSSFNSFEKTKLCKFCVLFVIIHSLT